MPHEQNKPKALDTRDVDKFLATLREQFGQDEADEAELRRVYKRDFEFVAGDQWDPQVKADREKAGRPALTFSRCHTFQQNVANEARQMRGEIHFSPSDDSTKDEAEVLEGLARQIQYNSLARVAYETAVDCASAGGFGYFGITTDYCEDGATPFDQEIKIRTIHDPLTVYGVLVPACFGERPRHAFIVTDIPLDKFKRENPDSKIHSWGDGDGNGDGWLGTETVRVAEYIWIETEHKTVHLLEDNTVVEGALPAGKRAKRTREVPTDTVRWCKTNGIEVLDETELPGSRIGIFAVLGKQMIVNGQPRLFSVIHHQKDAQQLINVYKTRIAETIATSPVQPYVGVEGQFAGHEAEWRTMNNTLRPYVEYKPVTLDGKPAPPPQRVTFEPPIAALSNAAQAEVDDMKATAGIYDASLGKQGNETSGIALARRQQQSNTTNLHYMDNLERTFVESGRELARLIPIIYDTPRMVQVLGPDEKPKIVKINQQHQAADGQPVHFDIASAGAPKYNVTVTMARSFTTKRMESFDQVAQVLQTVPTMAQYFLDIYFENSDMAGADRLAERCKKLLPPAMQDQKDGQPQIPPQVQQQMQQQGQMVEQLTQALNEAKERENAKAAELESKERIAAIDRASKLELAQLTSETQVRIAAIKANSDEAQTGLATEMDHVHQLAKNALERASMAQAQSQHEDQMETQRAAANQQAGADAQPTAGAQPAAQPTSDPTDEWHPDQQPDASGAAAAAGQI